MAFVLVTVCDEGLIAIRGIYTGCWSLIDFETVVEYVIIIA